MQPPAEQQSENWAKNPNSRITRFISHLQKINVSRKRAKVLLRLALVYEIFLLKIFR